jgi:hypothetical protein
MTAIDLEIPRAADAPAAVVLMDASEARGAADAIRASVANLRQLIDDFDQREGWKALGFDSFRAWALAEIDETSIRHIYRLRDAAQVDRALGVTIGHTPESHARELAGLAPAAIPTVVAAADALAAAEDRPRQAKDIRAAKAKKEPTCSRCDAVAREVYSVAGYPTPVCWNCRTVLHIHELADMPAPDVPGAAPAPALPPLPALSTDQLIQQIGMHAWDRVGGTRKSGSTTFYTFRYGTTDDERELAEGELIYWLDELDQSSARNTTQARAAIAAMRQATNERDSLAAYARARDALKRITNVAQRAAVDSELRAAEAERRAPAQPAPPATTVPRFLAPAYLDQLRAAVEARDDVRAVDAWKGLGYELAGMVAPEVRPGFVGVVLGLAWAVASDADLAALSSACGELLELLTLANFDAEELARMAPAIETLRAVGKKAQE